MKINITGKGIDLTDRIKDQVDKKLGKLDKFIHEEMTANVILKEKKGEHRVEVTIPLKQYTIRGEQKDRDLFAAIDKVEDALERQIRKYKTRLMAKRRDGLVEAPEVEADTEEVEINIVKNKRFVVHPMSAQEACMQMDLLDHDFFVFENEESGEINVVSRRTDGGYGLISPEE